MLICVRSVDDVVCAAVATARLKLRARRPALQLADQCQRLRNLSTPVLTDPLLSVDISFFSRTRFDFREAPFQRFRLKLDSYFPGWYRPGKVISLRIVTPKGFERVQLSVRFHSFSHNSEVHRPRQFNDCPNDLPAFCARSEVSDKRAVDLQRVEGQPVKRAQGRITCAEIVDLKPHTQFS